MCMWAQWHSLCMSRAQHVSLLCSGTRAAACSGCCTTVACLPSTLCITKSAMQVREGGNVSKLLSGRCLLPCWCCTAASVSLGACSLLSTYRNSSWSLASLFPRCNPPAGLAIVVFPSRLCCVRLMSSCCSYVLSLSEYSPQAPLTCNTPVVRSRCCFWLQTLWWGGGHELCLGASWCRTRPTCLTLLPTWSRWLEAR